jgi:hypothetical protein
MDPYNKAARGRDSHGDAPAPVNRVTDPYGSILAADQALLAKRIGLIRQQDLDAVAVEAGLIIDLAPSCPRWASRRIDELTANRDRRLGVEVTA